tara:strand:- start:501 stop:1361 length:861 start_codon:yes stop_codon:yes gene_type:complete
MKFFKYFFEYIFIKLLFILFRIIGYEKSSNLGEKIGKCIGPISRNNSLILRNLEKSDIGKNKVDRQKIIHEMWGNYGRILAEYPFLKSFSNSKLNKYIEIEGEEILNDLINKKKNAVFISGHFNNFELMAMYIEKVGINLAAVYRPLNNYFLNSTMVNIRKNFICKNQIKKGISGTRELLKLVKAGYSVALMIDQRVSEGIKSQFFNEEALTTTIPAQLVKKFNLDVIPIYIERKKNFYFKIYVEKPMIFDKDTPVEKITYELNYLLKQMILRNTSQWIWSHNRWK